MKTLSFVPTCVVLAACSDNGFHTIADAQPRAAGIEVTPASIDFGTLTSEQGVAVEHVTITSVGSSDLLVEDVAIGGKDASRFTLVDAESSFFLPAGASKEFDVAFDPDGSLDAVGQIVVTSDDEVSPALPVDLHGAMAVGRIAIEPDPVDFGAVQVGCDLTRPIDIVSVGDELVTVESIATIADGYSLSYNFPLPQTLEPGEGLTVDLTFAPGDERDFPGTIEVVSDEYDGHRIGQQFGVGRFADTHEDSWTLEDVEADILFFVDHSGSMADDAAALAANFEGFITHLNDYSSDWQIVVADNTTGCNLTGILSPSMSDYVPRFTNAVTSLGSGAWDEAGLTVAALGVEATDAYECNEGFLRDHARLHVILVSDEAEQSLDPWNHYVDAIVAKKGDASLVRISAIAGTASSACDAGEGFGYEDAAAATGGAYIDLCSDWAATMGALADATVTQDRFQLTEADVIPASIEVSVDGQAVMGGWTFDVANNTVVFDAASAPSQGSTVVVDYASYATCE